MTREDALEQVRSASMCLSALCLIGFGGRGDSCLDALWRMTLEHVSDGLREAYGVLEGDVARRRTLGGA